MLGTQFVQNNQAAAAQTWTKSKIDPRVLYANDTAKASGDRNEVSFATRSYESIVGTSKVIMVQQNLLWEYQLAADLAPFQASITLKLPQSLQNNMSVVRTRWQDCHVWIAGQLYGTNAKVDDFMAFRTHL
jgi:murein tripeptide amidase MpaA